MKTKKAPKPPKCDYQPQLGSYDYISFGVVEAGGDGPNHLSDVIGKRWYPTERPPALTGSWPPTTANWAEVLLNKGAPDHLRSVGALCAAYHSKPGAQIKHLAAQITIRFEGVDTVPQQLRFHEAFELGRGFALRLSRKLDAGAAFIMHVPATSWAHGPVHCHVVIPARHVLPGSGFGRFIAELVNAEEGRRMIDDEWRLWLQDSGYAL